MKDRRAREAAEARQNVERMQQQSEKLLTGAGHGDDDENDPIVILGKRIGRTLGYLIAAGLLVYLAATYLVK